MEEKLSKSDLEHVKTLEERIPAMTEVISDLREKFGDKICAGKITTRPMLNMGFAECGSIPLVIGEEQVGIINFDYNPQGNLSYDYRLWKNHKKYLL